MLLNFVMACYLIVVQAPAYPVREGVFATESAFAEHLRLLRKKLAPRFDRLLLAAPRLPDDAYRAQRGALAEVDEAAEGIELVALHPSDRGRLGFWKKDAREAWRKLRDAAARCDVVHAGLADDVWRPTMLFANVAGRLAGRPVLFVVDIDFRDEPRMFRETGVWGRRVYWTNRLLYQPFKLTQVHLAPYLCDLVLLKSDRMVREIGRGKDNVRNFFDTAHSADQIIDDDALKARTQRLQERERPLSFVFFGRFVEYKGLDRTLRAVMRARERSGRDLRLTLIGQGPELEALKALAGELGAGDAVSFQGAVPYGPELFREVAKHDVQLATPLVEDTPRAAFDAMAQGLPICAFGINYYRDLEEMSGAVTTVPWPDVEALAARLVALDEDRSRVAQMATAAVAFARENTQDIWLERRIGWTLEVAERRRRTSPSPSPTTI